MCYQHCFQHESRNITPIPATVKEMSSIPAKTSPAGFLEQSVLHSTPCHAGEKDPSQGWTSGILPHTLTETQVLIHGKKPH